MHLALTIGTLGAPFLAVLRKAPRGVTLCLFGLAILMVGVAGLMSAVVAEDSFYVLALGLPFLVFASLIPSAQRILHGAVQWLGHHKGLRGVMLMGSSFVAVCGFLEWTAFQLVCHGVARIDDPIKVNLRRGTEDWRVASILAPDREPDPVLFWRPRPVPPYNSQRFKGPEIVVPKPRGVVQVMCYGDSNTDGPLEGGWAVALNDTLPPLLPEKTVEVVNAGVSGYSSHQGLMRFKEEAETYEPDIILVSFGWNDAPIAVGKSDSEFASPPAALIAVQRFLGQSRAYGLLQTWRRAALDLGKQTGEPRVSVSDYVRNLHGFLDFGRKHGTTVVFLSRPHKVSVDQQARQAGWRARIPDYNRALLEFARENNAHVIDVQGAFEGKPEMFIDECHFTLEGHREMAEMMARVLAPLIEARG